MVASIHGSSWRLIIAWYIFIILNIDGRLYLQVLTPLNVVLVYTSPHWPPCMHGKSMTMARAYLIYYMHWHSGRNKTLWSSCKSSLYLCPHLLFWSPRICGRLSSLSMDILSWGFPWGMLPHLKRNIVPIRQTSTVPVWEPFPTQHQPHRARPSHGPMQRNCASSQYLSYWSIWLQNRKGALLCIVKQRHQTTPNVA